MSRVILDAIEGQQTKSLTDKSQPELSRENVINDHRLTADGESVSVQRFCVRLSDVDFDDFSPEQKNKITDMLRTQISRRSGVLSQQVWVGLQKGSLVVSGEVQEPNNYQAPTEEVRAIVRLVQEDKARIAEPAGEEAPTLASRVREAHDPLSTANLWNTESRAAYSGPQMNEEVHHSRGLKLVI